MPNGSSNAMYNWVMGVIGTLLAAAVIGLWGKVDTMGTELATLKAEKVAIQADLGEVKGDVKEILSIVTELRIKIEANP